MPTKRTSIAPRDRARVLEESRQAKMAESAHRYVRGNTRQFYEWLESKSGKSMPQGPAVWICGDCHVGNIGPLADLKGRVEIQIRDLDQTVIGNPAHDLVRLALSLATAARGSDLPGVTLVQMLEQMVEGYERGLATPRQAQEVNGNDELAPIRSVLDQSKRRRWHHLATERIKDVTPHIPLGERFWALTAIERGEIATIFENDAVVAKVREAKGRDDKTRVTVVDAAYWMKGCSSLGRLRYAVLLELRKKGDRDYCLIDLKEAAPPAAPHASRRREIDDAHRVVEGACSLSPNLGQRMMAVRLMKKPVVLRELMPQDLKFDLDRLTKEEAVAAAGYLAGVVAKAHGRQMDRQTRSAWRSELRRQHSKTLDAPSWLWISVVALIANHEAAYLEHCRRYAASA
jgi:uncharacterized protein (DUF2252 family)